jgi:hypothetical protein
MVPSCIIFCRLTSLLRGLSPGGPSPFTRRLLVKTDPLMVGPQQ